MVSATTRPRFDRVIEHIVSTTSIVSILAASATQWPESKTEVAECLVQNHPNITLAGHWIDKTPDAQRLLHDVCEEWATRGEDVAFQDVRESVQRICNTLVGRATNPLVRAALEEMAEKF